MLKQAVLLSAGCLIIATAAVFTFNTEKNNTPIIQADQITPTTSSVVTPPTTTPIAVEPAPIKTPPPTSQVVNLAVPQIWEIPDGVWVKPWNGACEESSITMVDAFYNHTYTGIIPTSTAKKLMAPLFPIEDKMFGSNSDTDAARTAKLINTSLSYTAAIKQNPTLAQIKQELQNGYPVISMHYGYDLDNPRHRFRQGGSSYHVMVITGYDDNKKIFYVNDPELPDGLDFSYKYDTILTTLHDFNYTDKKADGPPVVLFTRPGK